MNMFLVGEDFWDVFHQLPASRFPLQMDSHQYSDKEKQQIVRFCELVQFVLPCAKCRRHYTGHWKRIAGRLLDEYVETPLDWSEWWIIVHNVVNEMLRRPQYGNYDNYIEQRAIDRRQRKVQWFWFLDRVWHLLLLLAANVDHNLDNVSALVEWMALLCFELLPQDSSRMFLAFSSALQFVEAASVLKPTSKAWFDFIFQHYVRWRTRDDAWCGTVKHGVTSHCPSKQQLWDSIVTQRAL